MKLTHSSHYIDVDIKSSLSEHLVEQLYNTRYI